jgi:hypothetical protein
MTDRILIIGGPRTGKTTLADALAQAMGAPVSHADDVKRATWSDVSEALSGWLGRALPGPWLCEGVALPRALRKWLRAHSAPATPADVIYWLSKPVVQRTPGQETMAKGVETVWREVEPELIRRGVEVRNVVSVAGVTVRP